MCTSLLVWKVFVNLMSRQVEEEGLWKEEKVLRLVFGRLFWGDHIWEEATRVVVMSARAISSVL
jgi:hypothetical protein